MDEPVFPPPTAPRSSPRPMRPPTAPGGTSGADSGSQAPSPTVADRLVAVAGRLPALSPAGWLATAGASLLLVASIVVVAGNWASIDPIVRFAGLVAVLLGVSCAAEAGRRSFPSTSTALATLAACLTAPVGIAAAATLGQPWTVCTVVGGGAALVATHIQSRRWDVGMLRAATVVAFGVAAVGLAGLTGIPAPVIGSIGALGFAALGSDRRTLTLACAIGASPVAVGLADRGIGAGTLVRIGMTGEVLIWSAPVSCALAALATGVVAHRLRNLALAAASVALCGTGVITSLVRGQVGVATWLSALAIALLAAEAAGALRNRSIWRSVARGSAIPLATATSVIALQSTVIAILLRWGTAPDDVRALTWCVPFALSCAALGASTLGSARRVGGGWTTLAPLAAGSAAITTLAASGIPTIGIAAGAAAVWIVVSAVTPWSTWDISTTCSGIWVALAALSDDSVPWAWCGVVLVAGAITVAVCSIVGRPDGGFRAIGAAFVTAVVASIVAHRVGIPVDRDATLVFVGGLAIAAAIRPERSRWPLLIGAGAVFLSVDDGAATADWIDVALTAVLAVAIAGSARSVTSGRAHLTAACVVLSGGLALAAGGVDAGTTTVAASVIAIALSGLSTIDRRLIVGQTAAVVAAFVAVAASTHAHPVFASIALIVLGAQLIATGLLVEHRILTFAGLLLSLAAATSLWWTTGTNHWVITAIAPFGADGSDVALAAVSSALMMTGWSLRHAVGTSTWLAYSPGLGLAGSWLVASQLQPGTDWATFGALLLGVGAVAIGGSRRLGAPLVFGTAMVVITLIVSAGPRLATAPTWAWIATGGVLLLVVAAMIERTEQPLLPVRRGDDGRSDDGRSDDSRISLLEQFCDEFQ